VRHPSGGRSLHSSHAPGYWRERRFKMISLAWVSAPARDANQTRSLLSVAKSLSESKSQQWTMIAQSGLCSKTEPISHSMLSRSFASRPITQTGKLTTTNASNAGHLCAANNTFFNINTNPLKGGFCLLFIFRKLIIA